MDGYTDLNVSPNTTIYRLYVYIIILEIQLCLIVYHNLFHAIILLYWNLTKRSNLTCILITIERNSFFILPISCIVFSSLPIDAILVIKLNVCSTRQNVQIFVFNDVLNVLWMMMNKSIYE